MLRDEGVTLRATTREDLISLARFENDLGFVLAGGGDPPEPVPLERLQKDFDKEDPGPLANKVEFAMEADGSCIGRCGLYNIDRTARHAELGIGIGDKEYWGHGYGREAVGLLLDYAFRLRNFRRVWVAVPPHKDRGHRGDRSCHFRGEGPKPEHGWLAGLFLVNGLLGEVRVE